MSKYSTLSQTGRRYYRSNRNFAAPVETLGWARASNGKRKSRRASELCSSSSVGSFFFFFFFVCVTHNTAVCEWRWDNAGRPRMRDLITGIIRRDSRNCVTSCGSCFNEVIPTLQRTSSSLLFLLHLTWERVYRWKNGEITRTAIFPVSSAERRIPAG